VPRWSKWITTLICIVLLFMPVGLTAQAQFDETFLEIANEYIRIIVNNDPDEDTGRLSVSTTGGDPERSGDENQHLIYGGEQPWTSFTTFQIDRENWVYGNPTNRRAGINGSYGQIIQPPTIIDNSIVSSWLLGSIQVTQRLSLTRSSTTGLVDTAKIEYQVHNTDNVSHRVAVRLVLDTMLGYNDGAPFRFGEEEVLTDTILYGEEIPDSWLALDSLSETRVIAQGTLRGGEITTPDRVIFSNWGSIADSLFEFDVVPGRDFTRKGEFELDSAIALFWDPITLAPDETKTYITHYGLGGVTISYGELLVALHAPKDVVQNNVFEMYGLFESGNESEVRDITARLILPEGLELADIPGNTAVRDLGSIAVGETKTLRWKVRATGDAGIVKYEVAADAKNCESNSVKREIEILKPPEIQVTLKGDIDITTEDERLPLPIKLSAVIKNTGGASAYRLEATMVHPMFDLAQGETEKKYIASIHPGEEQFVEWAVNPDKAAGRLDYRVTVNDDDSIHTSQPSFIIVPSLKPKVWIDEPQIYQGDSIQAGDYFSLHIWATNIQDFRGAVLELSFDPEIAEIAGDYFDISGGTLFADEISKQMFSWNHPKVNNLTGKVSEIWGDRDIDNTLPLAFGTLVNIRFRAKKAGILNVKIDNVKLYDSILREISFDCDSVKRIEIR